MPGRMRSRNSTTVTFAPSRRHTEPSSSPITPPPTTSSLLRHLVERQRAGRRHDALLVDLDAGSRATSEPVAMTMFLASTLRLAVRRPSPRPCPARRSGRCRETPSILFFLNRKATPLTLPSTPSSLCAIIAGRSSFGVGRRCPSCAKAVAVPRRTAREAWSSALEGMQPMFRQVPPKRRRASRPPRPSGRAARRGWRDIAAGAGADDDRDRKVPCAATAPAAAAPGLRGIP